MIDSIPITLPISYRNAPSFPKQECQEIKKVSLGFDCRCGVPNRKEQSPYHSPLGTLHTDGTGVFMPNMEAIVGGVPTEEREYPWQVLSSRVTSYMVGLFMWVDDTHFVIEVMAPSRLNGSNNSSAIYVPKG